jgi:Tol biopolymer transport system component
MNVDGTALNQLTTDPGLDFNPVWSPDKRRIAFVSSRESGGPQVFIMNANGTGQRRISPQQYNWAADPGWSPDGQKIVFIGILAESGDIGVVVMNADGTNAVQLTREPCLRGCFTPGHPRFSPDGSKIVYHSAKSGNGEVWVINSDGSNPINLTNDPAADGMPSWSPDGRTIAFVSNRVGGTFAIFTMSADGGNVFQLTFPPLGDPDNNYDVDPAWSPDGRIIIFSGRRRDDTQLYTVSAGGGTPTKITSFGINGQPDWR